MNSRLCTHSYVLLLLIIIRSHTIQYIALYTCTCMALACCDDVSGPLYCLIGGQTLQQNRNGASNSCLFSFLCLPPTRTTRTAQSVSITAWSGVELRRCHCTAILDGIRMTVIKPPWSSKKRKTKRVFPLLPPQPPTTTAAASIPQAFECFPTNISIE